MGALCVLFIQKKGEKITCCNDFLSSQIRRISGTGKAMAKADKYQHKRYERKLLLFQSCLIYAFANSKPLLFFFVFLPHSEVRIYDPSGDSTIPSTSKKRKFEEVQQEEEEEAAEPATPVVKSKKIKKKEEAAVEGERHPTKTLVVKS